MQVQRIAAFTDEGAGGNPAGVVLLDHLPPSQAMQQLAAEVGYSETVFAAPSAGGWETRYFSPESEVPFCGHATIALGMALARAHGAGCYRLQLSGGEIEVEASMAADAEGGAGRGRGRATLRSLPTRNALASPDLVAGALALLGYAEGDLDEALPPIRMNAGTEHLLLVLRRRDRLAAMDYDLEAGRAFMRAHGLGTIALVWRETERLFHARNAFAIGGVLEDPATGAAAAALAGALRDRGILASGGLTILQGADMGCPSRIEVAFGPTPGSAVQVSGAAADIG